MKTQEEILERFERARPGDPMGFEVSEYLVRLDYANAKPWLKDDATPEDWEQFSAAPSDVKERMLEYMPFAWGKANDCRGISASRSVAHVAAWTWLIDDQTLLYKMERVGYNFYGKPILALVCDHFGWDWRQWDDDRWTNYEEGDGMTAVEALKPI